MIADDATTAVVAVSVMTCGVDRMKGGAGAGIGVSVSSCVGVGRCEYVAAEIDLVRVFLLLVMLVTWRVAVSFIVGVGGGIVLDDVCTLVLDKVVRVSVPNVRDDEREFVRVGVGGIGEMVALSVRLPSVTLSD